ncbi:D-alanyl-D-alanine carboxypeptidase/D-alanyl-D-alanine-endopeptidase [Halovulum dunhuangense]|uniref:D-alanyl-D-alanine carboxypeptidase/D-alanyl-D-alanine-endopeptidase n=1 Tax=Halovulum dunhuangense TaxID=1505036 RepID=A0A849L1T5_9RHOB|nr:D-alanyl-D-alanine carboxypeptidase/D-alanyl-D-alanine-endopeptidase [Halovulum dunhuangense]NNU80278.1 D-alanyl-D-alanine carboxypeptidase/D-alanyl-D-alanine-endopeptidase [Halovulum dunhuangense]
MTLSRRALLAGLAASLPLAAEARVDRAIRPFPRPEGLGAPPGPQAILAESGLAGVSAFALRDLATGRLIEAHRPEAALPPASVSKAATALYALDALGAGYRFRTLLLASGPVAGGRLEGDLYLVGGGDPHLDTDGLAGLAEQLVQAGVKSVAGRAFVVDGALPYHAHIDPLQPPHAGYNPAISGTNLNFNRVYFEWKPDAGGYWVAMTARGERFDPPVRMAEIRIAERSSPVFEHRLEGGRDVWSVARGALGGGGSRWLPVRMPGLYVAEVFAVLAAQKGVRLPAVNVARTLPGGLRVLGTAESAELAPMLRSMLRYSTNLTAEVVGLRAHQQSGGQPGSIAQSADAMTGWLRRTQGLGDGRFVNHSGLTDETRASPAELVEMLARAARGPLPGLLRDHPVSVAEGSREPVRGVQITAKTGTLNFTRGLAGYIGPAGGAPRLAFAILGADMAARAASDPRIEQPRGSRAWIGRARRQEDALLRRWAQLYV